MKAIKNIEKKTEKLPMSPKVKRGFRFYCSTVLAGAMVLGLAMPASATAVGDPLTVVNNQRSNGFLTLAGGIIITFAKEILTMITG